MEIRRGKFMLERSRRRLPRAQGTFKEKGDIGEAWLMLPIVRWPKCRTGNSATSCFVLKRIETVGAAAGEVGAGQEEVATGVSGVRERQMTSSSE